MITVANSGAADGGVMITIERCGPVLVGVP